MREEILRLMKEQLQRITNELTLANRKEMEQQVHRVFTILESTEDMLEGTPVDSILPSPKKESPAAAPKMEGETDKKPAKPSEPLGYEFHRRIKGGMLSEIDAFVPEIRVREMDLKEGDLVKATYLFKPESGPTRYDFEVVKRADTHQKPSGIVEIDMGIIEYFSSIGGLGIARTVQEDTILYQGEPIVLAIQKMDEEAFDLKSGDVVNVAFYETKPETCRVRWLHKADDLEASPAPKPSSYYKKKEATEAKPELDQVFAGKTICAIGFVPGHPTYQTEVESRGGTFIGLSGKESETTMAANIGKSDAVLLILGHVSHRATQWAVPFCKSKKIPFESVATFGRNTFIETAESLLEK